MTAPFRSRALPPPCVGARADAPDAAREGLVVVVVVVVSVFERRPASVSLFSRGRMRASIVGERGAAAAAPCCERAVVLERRCERLVAAAPVVTLGRDAAAAIGGGASLPRDGGGRGGGGGGWGVARASGVSVHGLHLSVTRVDSGSRWAKGSKSE